MRSNAPIRNRVAPIDQLFGFLFTKVGKPGRCASKFVGERVVAFQRLGRRDLGCIRIDTPFKSETSRRLRWPKVDVARNVRDIGIAMFVFGLLRLGRQDKFTA